MNPFGFLENPLAIFIFLFPLYFIYKKELQTKLWKKRSLLTKLIALLALSPIYISVRFSYVFFFYNIPVAFSNSLEIQPHFFQAIFLLIDGGFWYFADKFPFSEKEPWAFKYFILTLVEFICIGLAMPPFLFLVGLIKLIRIS